MVKLFQSKLLVISTRRKTMKTLGNIIWFVFGGFISAILYLVLGLVLCATIILIPFGVRCLRLAGLAFRPFGKTVESNFEEAPVKNGLWLAFGGAFAWLIYTILGLVLFVTIIGIPFGKQNFKLARYALRPFGATIEKA